ncbi:MULTISPECIES: hypothetical protein [unclassified Pseudodesulfovibrio]|uniref:hypothetical protein n=1 Tax=unclassified Pseudodesulfovibrio TaxID=2661612 RepID=UPI000FEBE0F6|nr:MULTISPECIES: hypothetical protein [unclassified Pseudodesulfovibrio]MCJ2166325.1 hypothetical protein [Pseudodesulfovibrio sp. S3-i]RWU02224.1 hypothetical protein DWB63_17305 [Pseudodesulfovibrio sp. S3]
MPTEFRYSALLLSTTLFLLLGAANAQAQDAAQQQEMTQVIQLYQGILKFPPPLWVEEVKDLGNSKPFRNQQKNLFSLEFIPKEQEFDSWKQLYGIYGFYLPDYDIKRFTQESINALALGCKAKPKITLASAENGSVILTYLCSDLIDPLVKDGDNTESGFLLISQVEQSFAKVYLAWRSKREYMKTDKWPMNKENITKAIEALKNIRYFPAEQ